MDQVDVRLDDRPEDQVFRVQNVRMTRMLMRLTMAASFALTLAAPVAAQNWPAKPLRLIISVALGTAMDDIPIFSETLPGFRAGGTGVLMTPTGTPGAIIQRMRGELDPIIRNPEYQQQRGHA